MAESQDDPAAVQFMALYARLRSMIDDDPVGLEDLAASDPPLWKLCHDLWKVAFDLSRKERSRRQLFAQPVNPAFISAWRDYETRFATRLERMTLNHHLANLKAKCPELRVARYDTSQEVTFSELWVRAESDAAEAARYFEEMVDWAASEVESVDPELFSDKISASLDYWSGLTAEHGLDLSSAFRRRERTPFVLVPRHVARHHGVGEKLSLFTHLQEAQEAFVFGLWFAALAMMRCILELVLRQHYGGLGADLEQLIGSVRLRLPADVSCDELHKLRRLANAVLHLNKTLEKENRDDERLILFYLDVLRKLIEQAPEKGSLKPALV
jgi:hypothetical protein